MKFQLVFIQLLILSTLSAQYKFQVNKKINVAIHPNIETYFIVENLSVNHIGHMIFTRKDTVYNHQPILTDAMNEFNQYKDSPLVRQAAELIQYFRDNLYDNAQILQFLTYQNEFPRKGEKYTFNEPQIFQTSTHPGIIMKVEELNRILQKFYVKYSVGKFLKNHKTEYMGALEEIIKDMKPETILEMEDYFGESFDEYSIYLMPLMPIPAGSDNYRAFGPNMNYDGKRVSAMFISSSKMIDDRNQNGFGFDNPIVTKFLTVHEIGHSFVNPHLEKYESELNNTSSLFTSDLQKIMEKSYVGNWKTCVIEHFVRLGEIRVAIALGDEAEAERLRKFHINEFGFVLIPILEEKIKFYEKNRKDYPNFQSFLPELIKVFDETTPQDIDEFLKNFHLKN